MPLSLDKIHELEMREDYPAVIDALEERLLAFPTEPETVTRLGFNLWFAAVEASRMQLVLPTEDYCRRFMELLQRYRPLLQNDADFCWAYGLGICLFWFYFPDATEAMGDALMERAKTLDAFYEQMPQDKLIPRYRGRGIWHSYYIQTGPLGHGG